MERILFYDGDCGICNWSVQFLKRHDPHRRLRFEPLQGDVAVGLLSKDLTKDLETAVYRPNETALYLRSDAVLHALIDTGSGWKFAAHAALCLPLCFRDPIYNWVARNRDRCELPR